MKPAAFSTSTPVARSCRFTPGLAVKGGFQYDERLRVERTVVEPAHGSNLTTSIHACFVDTRRIVGAKLAEFVTRPSDRDQLHLNFASCRARLVAPWSGDKSVIFQVAQVLSGP